MMNSALRLPKVRSRKFLALVLRLGAALLIFSTSSSAGLTARAAGTPAENAGGMRTVATSPQELNAPANIACLPFAEPTITEYNGDTVSGPYTTVVTQTFVTWRDESDSETDYFVYRKIDAGDWEEIAALAADSTNHTDTGLNSTGDYLYRVRAAEGGTFSSYSDICQKPRFLDSDAGSVRVFYRPYAGSGYCPDVEDLDGAADTMCSTLATAQVVADRLDLSYAWLDAYGFTLPTPPIAVDLTLCDGNGCARSTGGTRFMGMRPATMDDTFDLATNTGETALRVPRHELQHLTQSGVTEGGDGKWVSEGQARSVDDKYCLDDPTCDLTLDTYTGSWYTGDAADFLANPNRTLFESGYDAALFWTYISEQYGTLNQEPERGVDFISQFWISGQANAHTHGREVIDLALDDLGHAETFEDVFKDFAVANYAKDFSGAPAKYKYADEAQPPGTYGPVSRTVDLPLSLGQQYFADDEGLHVAPWAARYFRFVPAADVPTLAFESKTSTGNNLYYTLLAIDGGDIVDEVNYTGDHFMEAVANPGLDEVVLVVVGLEQGSNFNLTVNATQPVLRLEDPLSVRPAQAGDPAAPEKMLIKVAVLDPEGGGTPIAGLDPESFDVTVGGVVVPDNQLISSAYIQGEYWLLLRAPVQAGIGAYDLTVANDTIVGGTTLSATETSAVIYGAAIESDNVIVGDRSGSMDDFAGKLEAAQDAARLYVDSWETGDQMGVVSYSDAATVDVALQNWTNASRTAAFNDINAWVANGGTGIGGGLLAGLEQFDLTGDGSHPWNMLMISDGMETVDDPNIQDFVDEYNTRKDDGDQVPTVHVVALGPDADQATMQQLATDTGGTYHYAGELPGAVNGPQAAEILHNELAEIYRIVGETSALEQQIYAAHDTLTPPELHVHTIQVDGSASEAIFVVNYEQEGTAQTNIVLRNPNDVVVPATRVDGGGHFLYRVSTPLPGEWEVRLNYVAPGLAAEGANQASSGNAPAVEELHYLVEASLRSSLTLDVFLGLPPQERLTGRPMPILISLSDSQPLPGATVTATVTRPSGQVLGLTFYDDGLHGDGGAADGFYGATFYQTSQAGSYQLVVYAAGNSPLHGDFERRVRGAFFMAGGPDTDGDGLPTHWEEDNGLDPDVPNPSSSDPDGDGLFTLTEFQVGTHPLDPDTDNGGENDGSEHFGGRIPQDYPPDDGIQPPPSVGWPGAGQLWLTYPPEPDYDFLRVFRSVGPNGPFVMVADNVSPAPFWHDPNVVNGTEYCYRLMAVSPSGARSGSTDVTCVTPKLDPVAPEGSVGINNEAARASAPNVMLTLRASDAPADAHAQSEDDPPVAEDAVVSGVTHMMISNRGDFAGAVWEPFQRSKPWVLDPDNGMAVVYVKFRDRAGNVSDSTADVIAFGARWYLPIVNR